MKTGLLFKRPLVAGTVLWLAGYAAAWHMQAVSWQAWTIPCGLAMLPAAAALRKTARSALVAAALLLLSFGYFAWYDGQNQTSLRISGGETQDLDGSAIAVSGVIVSPVEVDGDKTGFVLETETVGWSRDSVVSVREALEVSVRLLKQGEQSQAKRWQRGDRIVMTGTIRLPEQARNFGGFDYRRYLRLHHIHWILTAKGTEQISISPPQGMGLVRLLRGNDELRDFFARRLDLLFPPDQSGYMKGLLIGYRADLDPQQFAEFARLGLTHLLAISGLHVAVFVFVLLWIFRLFRFPRETGQLLAIWLLPVYMLLTGASPSVIRAGLMAMIALYAARRQWLKDGLHLLCAAGLAMLLWNPYFLLDVGFQLSFLVTGGLIVGVPYANRLLPIRSPLWKSALSVTLVSQLVSFPLSIYYFNQFSLLSGLANLAMVPLVSFVVTPLGSAALAVSLVSVHVGQIVAWLTLFLNRISFSFVQLLDGWRWFHLIWPSPPMWWLAAYYATASALLYFLCKMSEQREAARDGVLIWEKPPTFEKRASVLSGVVFTVLLVYGYAPVWLPGEAAVEYIDVGQGDSIHIRTPGGRHLLVDGGGTLVFAKPGDEWKQRSDPYEVGVKLLVPLLKKRGVHRLDTVIMTHEDMDHIGGLKAVLEQIPVGRILFNGTLKTSKNAQELFHIALDKKIPLVPVYAGQTLRPDPSTVLNILYPAAASDRLEIEKDQNTKSIVFLMEMERFRFLFTGDIGKEGEAEMLGRWVQAPPSADNGAGGVSPTVDVLKVAHHGSKTSTTREWLDYWRPANAVISVGARNVYGHPTRDVLERLDRAGTGVYRTDLDGEVRVTLRHGALTWDSKLRQEAEPPDSR